MADINSSFISQIERKRHVNIQNPTRLFDQTKMSINKTWEISGRTGSTCLT